MVQRATVATARFVASRSLVALIAVAALLATLTTIVLAADPDNGTLTDTSGVQSWTGSLTPLDSTGGAGSCAAAEVCDVFTLTVNLPAAYWDTNDGGVDIAITWPSVDDDLDLYVFNGGVQALDSSGQSATTSEEIRLPEPANGVYSIRVDPFLLVNSFDYAGTVTLDSTPGDDGGVVVCEPVPVPANTVPAGCNGLESADAQGLQFTATVPADNQRDSSEPIVDTDLDGNIISCGPSGVSSGAEYASMSTDGGDQFHLLGTPPRGQLGLGGGGDCSWGFAPEKSGERYPLAYTGLGPLTNFVASSSTDGGENITATPLSGATIPGVDRQWTVFLNETDVLLSYNQQQPRQVVVQKATDGGNNYGLRVAASPQNPSFPGPMRALPAEFNPEGAAAGRVAYFPYNDGNRIFLSMSFNEGASFVTCHVADSFGDPSLFVTADHDVNGNIYVAFAEDTTYHTYITYLPVNKIKDCNKPVNAYPATATNPGWSAPLQVDRDNVRTTVFPWIVASGQPGRVAVAFYGTETDGNPNDGGFIASWDVYVAQSLNMLDEDATFAQVKATTHPFHYNSICQEGLGCTITMGDRSLADFFAIDHDPVRDSLVIVYDQGNKRPEDVEGQIATPAFVRQIAGPGMLNDTVAIPDREPLRTGSVDPTDDAISSYSSLNGAALGSRTNQPAGDFTSVEVGPEIDLTTGEPITNGGFTVTVTVDDLSQGALTQSMTAMQAQSLLWIFRFADGYEASAAGITYAPGIGFGAGYSEYTAGSVECGSSGDKCLQYPLDQPIAFDVDEANGVMRMSVPRSYLSALSPAPDAPGSYGNKKVPAEVPAVTGDRMYDATMFSLGNVESVTQVAQGFLYPLDNTPAFDFLLVDAAAVPPVLTVADESGPEGNTGTSDLTFTVTLDKPATEDVTFTATTTDGTATTADNDYTAVAGPFTITSGNSSIDVPVTVTGDATVEPDETFTLTISAVTGATIGDGVAIGTIQNDDVEGGTPALTINNRTSLEGAEGVTSQQTFTVTLSEAPGTGETVTVAFATADGSGATGATAGQDYTATMGTLTFMEGETTKTIPVDILGDDLDESNETYTVVLSNATDATITSGTGTGTITDDDPRPSISIGDVTVVEGDTGTVDADLTVTLTAASSFDVTATVGSVAGTATAADDYGTVPTQVVIPAGNTTATVTVPVNGDTLFEANEKFAVTLTSADNATLGDASGAVTITNDDTAPTLSIADVTVNEGNTIAKNVPFTITLSEASGLQTTVDVDTVDGTATQPDDYTLLMTTVVIEAGQTSGTATVRVEGDTDVEPDEDFGVTLSNPVNATIAEGGGEATGTIVNDDEAGSPSPTPTATDTGSPSPSPSPTATETPADERVERLGGANRFATGVLVSQRLYPTTGSADAVVVARGDDPNGYPDALSGVPFAHAEGAPLLIVQPDVLPAETRNEIQRVLSAGKTVYILGGESAVSPAVATEIQNLGYVIDRIGGETRIDTAIAIADRLGNPGILFITTGFNFPDALAAGTAAANVGGAVLLTQSEARNATTDAYLTRYPNATLFAVGGPAARPYPEATPVFGQTREDTAVQVATRFFINPTSIGLARSNRFPDALSGGPLMASLDGPILLTPTDSLSSFTEDYICANEASIDLAEIFGGTVAISTSVETVVNSRIRGTGC